MKTRFIASTKSILTLIPVALAFQNCSMGGFQTGPESGQSSLGSTVDNITPEVKIIAPLAGIAVQSQVLVSGSCENGLPVAISVGSVSTSTSCSKGMFSKNVSLTMADGNLIVTVGQLDLAGNRGSAQVVIMKDTTPPALVLSAPAANASITSSSFIVSGSCESGGNVSLSGAALAAPVSVPCSNQSFSTSVTSASPNGTKSFSVSQTDTAGNTANLSRSVQINIPAGTPVIKITAPAANLLTKSAITLTGTCTTGINVVIAGTGVSASKQVSCTNGAFSSALTWSAGDGVKNITVSQTNSSNQTGQDARSFNLDTTSPIPRILTPSAGTAATTGLTIGGSCETGLDVSIAGAGVASAYKVPCASAQFQTMVNFSANIGSKVITISQTDGAGNTGSHSQTFERIDTAPLNGATLYANNCAGCHSSLATTTKPNRSMAQIKSAIVSIPVMQGMVLTDPEVQAIANALVVAPPANTTALYTKSAYGRSELRRLTRYELTNTLNNALGVNPNSFLGSVPNDLGVTVYFDNEAAGQAISSSVIDSYKLFATNYAANVASNASRVSTLAGCTPASANDRACFVKFAQAVGRRLLRRPFTSTEANHYADILLPYAVTDNKFSTAVELLLRAWLQHPELLYRVESGTVANGLVELNDYQIATRISYLIWGSGPDDTLLDAAQNGRLKVEADRLAQAQRMLGDAKAKSHLTRFHSEWLGYAYISLNATLNQDMRNESGKLIERVVFDLNQDWMKLLTWNETYVTPQLASNYGMPAISNATWVQYDGQRGGGILSHGTFAALGSKFGDTSPTLRGYEVFKRLMCGKLGQIPAGVDTDNPPGQPGQCKPQSYTMKTNPSCMGCHMITDNIGFGLENIGTQGQWRQVEVGNTSCGIDGDGSVKNVAFNGPKELGAMLAADPEVSACATRQLFRFMAGRLEESADEPTLAALSAQYQQSKTFTSLVLSLVKSQAIMYKGAL